MRVDLTTIEGTTTIDWPDHVRVPVVGEWIVFTDKEFVETVWSVKNVNFFLTPAGFHGVNLVCVSA